MSHRRCAGWLGGRAEFPVVKVRAGASSLCWMADWCVKVL